MPGRKTQISGLNEGLRDALRDADDEMEALEVLVTIRCFDLEVLNQYSSKLGIDPTDLDDILDKACWAALIDEDGDSREAAGTVADEIRRMFSK